MALVTLKEKGILKFNQEMRAKGGSSAELQREKKPNLNACQ